MNKSKEDLFTTVVRGTGNWAVKGNKQKTDQCCYKGILHHVTFQTDKDVALAGLTFFGPPPEKPKNNAPPAKLDVEYEVFINIRESILCRKKEKDLVIFFAEKKFKVNTVTGADFLVEFPSPVEIPKNIWVDIGFQLEGPKTRHMPDADLFASPFWDKKKYLKVDVLAGSSKQLTKFHFLLN